MPPLPLNSSLSVKRKPADFVRTRKSDNPHLAVKHGPASGTGNDAHSPLRTCLRLDDSDVQFRRSGATADNMFDG
jgi:hypothetical protein